MSEVTTSECKSTSVEEVLHHHSIELRMQAERLARLEKKIMEPIAQSIVDNQRRSFCGVMKAPTFSFYAINVGFEFALTMMRKGYHARRECWKEDVYICLDDGTIKLKGTIKHAYYYWNSPLNDLMANDWIILEKKDE